MLRLTRAIYLELRLHCYRYLAISRVVLPVAINSQLSNYWEGSAVQFSELTLLTALTAFELSTRDLGCVSLVYLLKRERGSEECP